MATFDPREPTRLDPRRCTWVHTKLPEVDAAGRRTTRTDWSDVRQHLQRFGLPLPDASHQSALGAPLSDKSGVLTALGATVVRGSDSVYGTRFGVRLDREPGRSRREAHPQTSLFLLQLIAAMGRLEGEMREVSDDLGTRIRARRLSGAAVEDVEAGFAQILGSLAQLRSDTRTTVDMIGSTLSSAHLKIARAEASAAAEARARHLEETRRRQVAEAKQREREQRLARTIALLTSVLLIPTLVASIFGANVELPRQETEWETYLMFASMVGLGTLSYALLRELDPTRKPPGWKMRLLPALIAVVSLAAAFAIAIEASGTT